MLNTQYLINISINDYKEDEFIHSLKEFGTVRTVTTEKELLSCIEDTAIIFLFDKEGENLEIITNWVHVIRQYSNCFIWLVTESAEPYLRYIYLRIGLDDYFEGDQSIAERSLLVEKYLSRQMTTISKLSKSSSDLQPRIYLNKANRTVKIDSNQPIKLTKLEYQVLEVLHDNLGTVVTYSKIGELVWPEESVSEHTKMAIANIIFHIRNKMKKFSVQSDYLRTVRSLGYVLEF